jgi:hypothetical protein
MREIDSVDSYKFSCLDNDINSFTHITDTERNITRNYRENITRNSQFTRADVTLQLQTVQQLQEQNFTLFFLGIPSSIHEMEQYLFLTDYFKLS